MVLKFKLWDIVRRSCEKQRELLRSHLVQDGSAQQKPDPQTLWFHGQKTRWQNQRPTLDYFLCQRQKDVCSARQVTGCEVSGKHLDLERGREKICQILLLFYPQQYKITDIVLVIFLGQFCPRPGGKGAMRFTLCEAPARETRPDHHIENYVPYSFR